MIILVNGEKYNISKNRVARMDAPLMPMPLPGLKALQGIQWGGEDVCRMRWCL